MESFFCDGRRSPGTANASELAAAAATAAFAGSAAAAAADSAADGAFGLERCIAARPTPTSPEMKSTDTPAVTRTASRACEVDLLCHRNKMSVFLVEPNQHLLSIHLSGLSS